MDLLTMGEFWFTACVFFLSGWIARSALLALKDAERDSERP